MSEVRQHVYASVRLSDVAQLPSHHSSLSLSHPSPFIVLVDVGRLLVELHTSDGHINLYSKAMRQWDPYTISGLLAQTWTDDWVRGQSGRGLRRRLYGGRRRPAGGRFTRYGSDSKQLADGSIEKSETNQGGQLVYLHSGTHRSLWMVVQPTTRTHDDHEEADPSLTYS